ncbi:hypothetical protein JTB14_003898 [Gonioctena quinquepunctata]|nr:hypothetical protein JTB14_003898 [Gonioctena quinquepunctata]
MLVALSDINSQLCEAAILVFAKKSFVGNNSKRESNYCVVFNNYQLIKTQILLCVDKIAAGQIRIMEEADLIQELLKNTGWSCDDLLERIQKLKTTRVTHNDDVFSLDQLTENTDLNVATTNENAPEVTTKEAPKLIENKTQSLQIDGDLFSETDDEEEEIHETNQSIINEIIGDIATKETQKSVGNENDISTYQENEYETVVTEVRVIEVNNDGDDHFEEEGDNFEEEDDNFEEEDDNFEEEDNFTDCTEFLETYPRKSIPVDKAVTFGMKRHLESESEKIKCVESFKRMKIIQNESKNNTEDMEVFSNQMTANPSNTHEEKSVTVPNKSCDTLLETSRNELLEQNENTKNEMSTPRKVIGKEKYIDSSKHENRTETLTETEENVSVQDPPTQQCQEFTLGNEKSNKECQKENTPSRDIISQVQNRFQSLNENAVTMMYEEDGNIQEDLSDSSVADTDLSEDENSTLGNLEDIRNNLKLQLSSLRTRKKEHFLQTETKVKDLEASNEEPKTNANNEFPEESDLFSQTNEFGLVILDVKGGVEFEGPENDINNEEDLTMNSTIDNNKSASKFETETNINNDQHGVFDEIRKIISKQKSSLKPNEKSRFHANLGHIQPTITSEKNDNDKIILSSENSQSPFLNECNKLEGKSPFVSNSLDEFLIGDSKLNISYKVPTCSAEKGLKDNLADELPLLTKRVIKLKENLEEKPKKTPAVKAKTVAQKRKLLEREKKRELRKLEKLKKVSLKQETKVKKEKEHNRSFVLFNNEKIWVKSEVHDKCIAKIGCQNLINKNSPMHSKRRLSLLSGKKMGDVKIRYLPGPLSKKNILQRTGLNEWETQTKTLPQVFLEVLPKIEQRFPDHIINRFKQFHGELCSERIEFALSVLKIKKGEEEVQPQIFSLPLKYHNNQEMIVTRKRKLTSVYAAPNNLVNEENKLSIDTIADVIENLIRYVEIKEIAPTLIKEDDFEIKVQEESVGKLSPINNDNVSIFKKPQKRKSKVESELLRLNCKLVNVEVEDSPTEGICGKSYCQLGCICKTLKCENVFSYHCQRFQCMFNCTCPKEKALVYNHNLTLPAGTDILSTDTVNRIEDEAKRNLAKEEREFTQTVIHTNDKTIVVGLGGRNKLRRNTKTPAKFSDYVDSYEGWKNALPEKDLMRKCTVNLPKLNLSEIIPYCLAHNAYNCYCKGSSASISNLSASPDFEKGKSLQPKILRKFPFGASATEGDIETVSKIQKPSNKSRSSKTTQDCKSKEFHKEDVNTSMESKQLLKNQTQDEIDNANSNDCFSESRSIVSKTDTNRRPVRHKKKKRFSEDFIDCSNEMYSTLDCARTRVFSFENHKQIALSVEILQNDFSYNIKDSDILKAKIQASKQKQQLLEVDILKQSLIEQCLGNVLVSSIKSKRKKALRKGPRIPISSPSFNEDGAIQRRKKNKSVTQRKKEIKPVFDGEIIVDKSNLELLSKMGAKTLQDGYARLLPWKALIESFQNGTVNIWSMVDQPSRLLINKSDKKSPKNYVNIKESNQTTEVVLWILRNRLPSNYQEDSISFILKETKDNYEICGVCTRNIVTENLGFSSEETVKKDDIFSHKDLNGAQQSLHIEKLKFRLQELIEESSGHLGEISIDKSKLYMWAALPEVYRVCKWRVIYLNSDFTYLYFPLIKYSIRYTDLLAAGKTAKDKNSTVRLKNDLLQSGYDHLEFGMYFDPHYLDRVFIGPYFKQYSGNDVETLRYINKTLVSTESFNRMRGKGDYKCGHWLVERPYSAKRSVRQEAKMSTIDLTKDEDIGDANVKETKKSCKSTMLIMHNSEQIQIIDAPSKKPEEFNRYIITNIPHFGYLGAFRHFSGEIDVSWPFEEKLLRFPNVSTSIDFLQERFSALLQPVPETFKINIIVLTQIDLNNAIPIDSGVLTGHYICGEFGFENITTMTNEDCMNKTGKTQEEIMKMYSRKAQLFLKKRVINLASILNIEGNEHGFDVPNVLNKATAEIQYQMKQEKRLSALKNELLVKKRNRALKLFEMISKLPTEKRNIESQKFRNVLNKSAEPIEIPDSDEEVSRETATNKDNQLSKTNNQLSPDILKVMNPRECLESVIEATKQKETPSAPRRKNDCIMGTPVAASSPNIALKSVLKPLIRVPIDSDTSLLARGPVVPLAADGKEGHASASKSNLQNAQYISGVKLIKSISGNFVLVNDQPDESPTSTPSNLITGTKVVIQNNKIKTMRKLQPAELNRVRRLRKVSGEDLRLLSNTALDCQVIENINNIDGLDTGDALVIDLDENETDPLLIVNDTNSLESDDVHEIIEDDNECDYNWNRRDGQELDDSESDEVVTISVEDIMKSDGNVHSVSFSEEIILTGNFFEFGRLFHTY